MRSMEDPNQMQEERRLMYVGLTRAKDRLYLIYAFRRSLYGDSNANMPSRFLYDIPEDVRTGAVLRQRGVAASQTQSYTEMTRWEPPAARRSAPPSQAPTFKAGACVWHQKYGEGVVVGSARRGDMDEVDVLFPGGVGQKTIMADFLKPMESDSNSD
jgi:DNA helicase-2/ATP-dependent DNA helicase PcrA